MSPKKSFSLIEKKRMVESALWEGLDPSEPGDLTIQPNWVQVIRPQTPTVFLNGVYRCEWEEESTIDQKIAETIEQYRVRKIPFRWKVTESSRPVNLSLKLKNHGLIHKETLLGLFALPEDLDILGHSEVEVRLLTLENLEDWLKLQHEAWNVPEPGIHHLRKKMTLDLKLQKGPYENYIAYLNDEPVGSAGLRYYSDYAYLVGAVVLPRFRKKGIYKSLLAHRVQLIKKKGLAIVNHCLENTSAPICLKLGFEKVVKIESFENAIFLKEGVECQ